MVSQETLRCFIAVELPQDIRDELVALAVRLKDPGLQASWVSPGNMHLTLRFLGDVTAEGRDRLIELLSEAYQSVSPFTLQVREVGVFPNLRRPNVIWAGVHPLEGPLQTIQAAAEMAARAIGLPPETKPFKAHLTLARVKQLNGESFQARFDTEREFAGGEFTVHGVSLLSSKLTPKGAIHTCLREFHFD